MITSLLKNSGIYFTGLSAGKVLTVLLFVLLARLLGPSSFGQYVFFLTVLQLITIVSDIGLIQWFQKEAHVSAAKELMHEIIPVRIVTLVVSGILTYAILTATNALPGEATLLLVLTMIPEAFLSVLDGYYFHLHRSFMVALKTVVRTAFMIIGVLLFRDEIQFFSIIYVYVLTAFVTMIWYTPWHLLLDLKWPTIHRQIQVVKSSMKYATLIFTSFAYARSDSILIKAFINDAALGMYGAAYRFLESLSLLPTALSHNLFPVSSKEGKVTKTHVKHITSVMTAIGIIMGLVVWLGADLLITFLVGAEYAAAIPVLKIFAFVLVLFFINAPLSTVIQSSSLVKKFLPWGVANTAVNILLNVWLIPIYGIMGAAVAMLISEITGLLINFKFVKKLYG